MLKSQLKDIVGIHLKAHKGIYCDTMRIYQTFETTQWEITDILRLLPNVINLLFIYLYMFLPQQCVVTIGRRVWYFHVELSTFCSEALVQHNTA